MSDYEKGKWYREGNPRGRESGRMGKTARNRPAQGQPGAKWLRPGMAASGKGAGVRAGEESVAEVETITEDMLCWVGTLRNTIAALALGCVPTPAKHI